MSKFPYKQRTPGSLKEAAHQLIKECGGLDGAAEIARVRKSQLFRYTNDSEEDANCHMPADVVRSLEAYCGQPIITEYLAAAQGCVVFRPEPAPAGATIPQSVAEIAEQTSKLFHEFALAFADGRIDPAEAGKMLKAGDAAVRHFMRMRPELMARIEGRG